MSLWRVDKGLFLSGVPWVALSVAVTFSLYAVARKRLKIDPFGFIRRNIDFASDNA